MFKVTAHVFKVNANREQSGPPAGKMVFTSYDFDIASDFAANFESGDNTTANIDFEMLVPIGRRPIWIDANIHCIERAVGTLMTTADILRRSKIKAA